MSHPRILKQSGLVSPMLAASVLAFSLACLESLSYGDVCLPPTPSPCAADGVCRPNGDWGYSRTRWRQWPGDPGAPQPTPSDAETPGQDEEQGLRGYETPAPEQEDLRGPAKGKDKDKGASSEEDEVIDVLDGALDGGPAAQPLLGPEALPGFDPQGILEALPPADDAPPALPESLRQSASIQGAPRQTAPMRLPIPTDRLHTNSKQTNPNSKPITQASWQQPKAIGLINPASAIVVQPEKDALQQAIYYEASDQPQNELK